MKKICLITTSPLIVNFFLVPHIHCLKQTYRVSLAVNAGEGAPLPADLGVEVITLPILRKISLWRDLRVLAQLLRLFRQRRFDSIHSFSPKAGLLAMAAGWIARVPVRMHTYTGQVWMTRSGLMRSILRCADSAVARFATHLLADSLSQRQLLVESGIIRLAEQCQVLGSGSLSGVDIERFGPDDEARAAVRQELAIRKDATVFLFLGRLTRDKGVFDLAHAFARVAATNPALILLLVGPDEEDTRPKIESLCRAHAARLRFAGYTRNPERYVAAADVLCLPSYREGFGSAVIEAAAAGVPAIGSRIYGITDAIVDGETGLLHAPGDSAELADRMARLAQEPTLRERLGARARARAINDFSQQRLTRALLDYYRSVLDE